MIALPWLDSSLLQCDDAWTCLGQQHERGFNILPARQYEQAIAGPRELGICDVVEPDNRCAGVVLQQKTPHWSA